jgi:hypothetical protein
MMDPLSLSDCFADKDSANLYVTVDVDNASDWLETEGKHK